MKRLAFYGGITVLLFLLGFTLARGAQARVETIRHTQVLMGTVVDIQVRERDRDRAEQAVAEAFAEMRRVDRLFSTMTEGEVWALNTNPDDRAAVSTELMDVLEISAGIWQQSEGAFDAGLNNLIELWGFGAGAQVLPSPDAVAAAARSSGWAQVRLVDSAVERPAGLGLNFGGIAKGYAVDRAVEALRARGITSAMVNAGGEIRTLGEGWLVGIQHPRQPERMIARLRPGQLAVATSGDYEQYFELDGVRYHHLLDPRTGYPAQGVQSVTVIAPTCAEADGWSTAVFVLGPEAGLAMIEQMENMEAYLVDASGQVHMTSGFESYLVDK